MGGCQNETGKTMSIAEVGDGTWGLAVSLLVYVFYSLAGARPRGSTRQSWGLPRYVLTYTHLTCTTPHTVR